MGGAQARADQLHVQVRGQVVRPRLHAALGGWAEASVVQTTVTMVVATLLQGYRGSDAGHTHMDHQLVIDRKEQFTLTTVTYWPASSSSM